MHQPPRTDSSPHADGHREAGLRRNVLHKLLRTTGGAALLAYAGLGCSDHGNGRPAATGGQGSAGLGAGGGLGGGGGVGGGGGGASGGAGATDTGGAKGGSSGGAYGGMTSFGGDVGGAPKEMGGAPAQAGAGGVSVGGAGGTTTDVTSAPTGGVDWEEWPPVVVVPPIGTCEIWQFSGGEGSTAPKPVAHEIWTYDAPSRILTRRHLPIGKGSEWVGYARLDAQGRREMICHAQETFDCLEWTRDAHGNAKGYSYYGVADGPLDARTLDPAHPPTKAKPTGGPESETDILVYDAAGLISRATYAFPQSGATLAFSRDGEGRCNDVTWTIFASSLSEVDHWTYADGKLVSRTVTNLKDPQDVRAVMTYGYDGEGVLATTVVDGWLDFPDNGDRPAKRDGVADYIVRTQRLPTGDRWIETLDFQHTDTRSNSHIRRNGVLTSLFRMRWYFSPGCEKLGLPRHTSQDCEFERPLASMPLSWHNPLITPIPIWTMTPMPD